LAQNLLQSAASERGSLAVGAIAFAQYPVDPQQGCVRVEFARVRRHVREPLADKGASPHTDAVIVEQASLESVARRLKAALG
jgi:hypothetical protein